MLGLRRAALIAMIPLIVVAVATSCTDEPAPGTAAPDAGAQPGQLAGGVCPDAAPEAGQACVLPEGTTCSFAACGAAIAECTRGTWRFGGNPAPFADATAGEAVCPKDFPASSAPCPCGFPTNVSCRYGTCDGADATANVSSATCDAGLWSIAIVETCTPNDAGADVQHDARPDVD
jgi:hypothetical protein